MKDINVPTICVIICFVIMIILILSLFVIIPIYIKRTKNISDNESIIDYIYDGDVIRLNGKYYIVLDEQLFELKDINASIDLYAINEDDIQEIFSEDDLIKYTKLNKDINKSKEK